MTGKEVTIKIHQSLQESGACVYPSLPGPTSFHLAHPAPASFCDTSSICSVLVLQKWEKNPPGFPLAHCAHQVCPAQVFDLMDVEKV